VTTICVESREAHSKGRIDEALVRKFQLLLFIFRQTTVQVDEEDMVTLSEY
jgi:hypothetical protein